MVTLASTALLFTLAAVDPRSALIEQQLRGERQQALERVERELAEPSEAEAARSLGYDYLRGHLLQELGRKRSASDAFRDAMASAPPLEPYSRYRMAQVQAQLGHPEVATGLLASVVKPGTPRPLLGDAVLLLTKVLSEGGDCRLVRSIDPDDIPGTSGRRMALAQGDCELRAGRKEEAARIYLELLDGETHDEPEREAAQRLSRAYDGTDRKPTKTVAALLGQAFHQHRDFDRAIHYLNVLVPDRGATLPSSLYDLAYLRARSFFWQERYEEAAMEYAWLATQVTGAKRARNRYQEGRCYELLGRQRQALQAFRDSYRSDSSGPYADSGLMALMRLHMVLGMEDDAVLLLEMLEDNREWRETTARAALFMASSDLVRGRSDRAGPWLAQAVAADRDAAREVDYWQGRLAELERRPANAIANYLAVLHRDRYHPMAQAALKRLRQTHLESATRAEGERLSTSGKVKDLYSATLLLPTDSPAGQRAHRNLVSRLRSTSNLSPWVDLEPVEPDAWPLWKARLNEPEEMLLALGIWDHAVGEVNDHFPNDSPRLVVTSAQGLAAFGETQAAIRRAEILQRRVPEAMPEPYLAPQLRRLLHPLAHWRHVNHQSERFGIDPLLLASIIREESRYDERALSGASARGLTQFVQPTALRVASDIGLDISDAEDLYQPEVAITLGAAYLGELVEEFRGAPESAVASYNAGPPQARVWRSYTMSSEPEEYYTKVSFTETRGYLRKVLSSWARYHALYAPEPSDVAGASEASNRSTTGGRVAG